GAMALVIRAELFQPGLQIVEPHFFNQMTTMHALVMIFGVVMPAFVGFANWQIPMMIGAPDMALPRMNNWSFWILPFAFTLLLSTLFQQGAGGALDAVPAAVGAGRHRHRLRDPVDPYDGYLVGARRHQYHRHRAQHARARHAADENAAVRVDLAD